MSRTVTCLLFLVGALALGGCASQSVGPAAALNDSQRAECATLRAQNVDMNQTAVMPDYCKNAGGMSWSSEPADPIKLDLGKDKQGDQ
jgi:hypothetical protein